MMPRVVEPEVLDGLTATDPTAMRSRIDLQRIHRIMGTRTILHRGLCAMASQSSKTKPLRLLEIGAGDGSLMLGVAQTLAPFGLGVELTLFDRLALIQPLTIKRYAEVGWTVTERVGDVLTWASEPSDMAALDRPLMRWDLIIANLFLHHFKSAQLRTLLMAIAARSQRFFACEPRRNGLALAGSHLLGALGANPVTRQDAVVSVHAGFNGDELSVLWPETNGPWQVQEYSAGLFSHCFVAQRAGLK